MTAENTSATSSLNAALNNSHTTESFQLPITLQNEARILSGDKTRFSRDEMNLAEFPLTVLSKRADPSVKTLEFTDSVKGKNGDLINRKWIITGADKFGLPTSSDDEVLLGLLKLTADDGLKNRKVHFTRYELLRILRWTTEGRNYSRLQNALDRLSGVRIKATNAFYDNESKLHSTRNFGILDAYEINDGRDARPSFFTWSEVLFKSFQVGFIKKLDLDFYLRLESAVSKRLYRYLDKHFWYKQKIQINLFTLAHEKIGVSRRYGYVSSLRQQLDPALEELVSHGLISNFEYMGRGKSTEIAIYAGKVLKPVGSPTNGQQVVSEDSDLRETVLAELIKRGLHAAQTKRLVASQTGEGLSRIKEIIIYFDKLVSIDSHLISKSPQGFLYRAVENPFAFTLPGEKVKAKTQENLLFSARPQPVAAKPVVKETIGEVNGLEGKYLTVRKKQIDSLRNSTPASVLSGLRQEVQNALGKLRALISETRFQEAVEHGIDQKLLSQACFPDFEEWKRAQMRRG